MRRLRPIRRRDRRSERELPPADFSLDENDSAADTPDTIEPFVPVPRQYEDYDETPPPRRRRLRLPRPSLGVEIHLATLLAALALIAAGIVGTLLSLDRLDPQIEEWWPAAVLGLAALWMLVALVQRQVASFLSGAGLAGLGLSLLMETQEIAELRETMLGVVLVTIGLGIVMRGFLLRQRTSIR